MRGPESDPLKVSRIPAIARHRRDERMSERRHTRQTAAGVLILTLRACRRFVPSADAYRVQLGPFPVAATPDAQHRVIWMRAILDPVLPTQVDAVVRRRVPAQIVAASAAPFS